MGCPGCGTQIENFAFLCYTYLLSASSFSAKLEGKILKFLHTGDLHIGKRVNEISMLEEQRHILQQITEIAVQQQVDAILIAGDIYDKSVPPAEAVCVFDWFLTELAAQKIPVFAISGNHDSAERLAFVSSILDRQDIHFSPVFRGTVSHHVMQDTLGAVHIYLLPFLKPAMVRPFFPEETIESYDDAIRFVLDHTAIDPGARNILIAHQFVVSDGQEPERCDSETVSVGGIDSVSAALFDGFDYVALGHLHGRQSIGRETIHYSGSPLKYSFSEVRQEKGVTIVSVGEKGDVHLSTVPLTPIHEMRELHGPIEELLSPLAVASGDPNDYLHVTLTDAAVMDAAARVRSVYPNLMKLDFDNALSRANASLHSVDLSRKTTDLELFIQFYEMQNQQPLTGESLERMRRIIEEGAL